MATTTTKTTMTTTTIIIIVVIIIVNVITAIMNIIVFLKLEMDTLQVATGSANIELQHNDKLNCQLSFHETISLCDLRQLELSIQLYVW